MSPGFQLSQDLELRQETKVKGRSKVAGKVSIDFEILGHAKKEERKVTPPREIPKLEPKEYKSFQLYLYIESASQLYTKRPNLYVSYKSFPDNERISTPVLWAYEEGSLVNHSMLFPLTATEAMVAKLLQSALIIEVWDKDAATDRLLGITKLSLQSFGKALSNDMTLIMNSAYPLIAVDEHRAISSL